jgi:hypothetical protein
MKNALLLVLKFFVLTLALTFAACAVYYLYLLCTKIVSGTSPVRPPFTDILSFVPLILAASAITAGLVAQGITACKKMRFFPQITAALLVVFTWLAVIPFCGLLDARLKPFQTASGPASKVSAGYFRPYIDGLFFSTGGESAEDGIFLPTAGAGGEPVFMNGVPARALQRAPFSDVLVANSLPMPSFFSLLSKEILFFWQAGERAWKEGYLSWLFFASICIPLASISAHARAGSWSLKNFAGMVLLFGAVFFVNRLYLLWNVSETISRLGGIDMPGERLSTMFGVFQVTFNALIGAIILLTGTLFSVIAARRENGGDD